MKKYCVYFISILLLAVFMIQPAAAELPLLFDEADLLTDREEAILSETLEEIRRRQNMDIVIVTVNSTEDRTATEYADDFYDYSGYAEDGLLLLVSMEEREWAVSTSGYGITAFTDAGLDYLTDQITGFMSSEEWNPAFLRFAELCDEFITQARNGSPFDSGNLPKKPFTPIRTGLLALAIGFGIAFFKMNSLKNQLNSVRTKEKAADYVKKDSLTLTESRDFFLYRNVSRTQKSESSSGGSSTHTSSSGKTHGGSSGKF